MNRRAVVIGLVALVVIDIFVVTIALGRTTDEPSGSVAVVPGSPADGSGGEPSLTPAPPATSPSASPTASAPPPEPPVGLPLVRWIDAVSESELWRSTAATCPENSVIERSVDGGVTWTALNSPAAVIRLNAQQPDEAFVVGAAGRECDTSFWSTENASTWKEGTGNLGAAWYLEPDGVHSPSGSQAVPCTGRAIDLAARTQAEGAVLCADGAVHVTDDGAEAWTALGTQPGSLALTRSADAYLLAAAGVRGCPGVVVMEVAEVPVARGCAGGTGPTPGSVAITAVDESVWVWVGNQVLASRDAGQTWE